MGESTAVDLFENILNARDQAVVACNLGEEEIVVGQGNLATANGIVFHLNDTREPCAFSDELKSLLINLVKENAADAEIK